MGKGWALVVIGACAALVALLVFGVVREGDDTSIDEALASGERPAAPGGSLEVLGGDGTKSLADYRGEVVVLNFWASWCPPCVDELPLLEGTQDAIESSGATVLGINYKDIPEDAFVFTDDHKITFPNLRDPDGEFADEYGVTGIPETFVIDRDGDIAALRRGPIDKKWLDEELSPLLAEGGLMRSPALVILAALLLAAPAAAAGEPSLADIEDEVMCVECGTPLNLSTSGVADREREYIEREIAAGKSKEEIKDGLVDRFGPSVLAVPDDEGFGLAAYLVPALVVLAALIAVVLAARRWRRPPAGGEPSPRALATEDTDRLDRELAALDDD